MGVRVTSYKTRRPIDVLECCSRGGESYQLQDEEALSTYWNVLAELRDVCGVLEKEVEGRRRHMPLKSPVVLHILPFPLCSPFVMSQQSVC